MNTGITFSTEELNILKSLSAGMAKKLSIEISDSDKNGLKSVVRGLRKHESILNGLVTKLSLLQVGV